MSTNPDAKNEHPSTYIVPDRANLDERLRVHIQDQMMTAGMGGVLPDQPDPTHFKHILDVGCGTGYWLTQTALTYPDIPKLVGVDISSTMIEYARQEAEKAQVSDRVQFHVMDALRMLEFPDDSFDLVNHRFAVSWLRTWDWPKLLSEYQRVARSGATVRITEIETGKTTSPASEKLGFIVLKAFHQAGHYFVESVDGLTSQIGPVLTQHGFLNVQTHVSDFSYQAGTEQWRLLYEDSVRLYRVIVPFLQKWTRVPDDYEETYQQMCEEMQRPDFTSSIKLLTTYGTVPQKPDH